MTRWTDENLYQGRTEEQARKNDEAAYLLGKIGFWMLACGAVAWLAFAFFAALTAQ
jgi:hypothetical protein